MLTFIFSMGAKTQHENKKLNVPAPGAYNIPDKVSNFWLAEGTSLDNWVTRQDNGGEDQDQATFGGAWTRSRGLRRWQAKAEESLLLDGLKTLESGV